MIKNKSSVVRWLTLGGVLAVLGSVQCGNTTDTSGTETHWLAVCSADAECGGLHCLCGVCTEDCADDDACQEFADTAVCAAASATEFAGECGTEPKLCVRPSDVTPGSGGGSASSSSGGSTGGSGSSGGNGSSTGAAGAAGAATAAACDAEDARGVGTGTCERDLGSRWTGEACEPLYACDCEGADCDEISETYDACAQEHTGCFSDQDCFDERREIVELLNANKSCTDTSDCVTHSVGCGVSEDDCTGAVYSNAELDRDEVQGLADRLSTCVSAFEGANGSGGCALCERAQQPPQCVEGRCIGTEACALERSMMAAFVYDNDACETTDDCVTEVVGCGVSEDDCTGGVYLNGGFDNVEFERLKSELYACAGDSESCALCERETTPAACVSGRCQRE